MRHKTAIATAASISGVLLASVAALGANVGILRSNDNEFGQLSASVGATPSDPADGTSLYRIPGVADISLAASAGRLTVLAVTPTPGWNHRIDDDDGSVEIHLTSATERIEFEAWILDGEVETRIERTVVGAVGIPGSAPPTLDDGRDDVSDDDRDDDGSDRDDDRDDGSDDDGDDRGGDDHDGDDDHDDDDHDDDDDDGRHDDD